MSGGVLRTRWRLAVTAGLAGTLVAGPAWAATGSVDDPADTPSPVDVSRIVHRDDNATFSWEISTYEAFTDEAVTTCLLALNTDSDVALERQVSVGWDRLAGHLNGRVSDAAGNTLAPAHVTRLNATSLRVSVRRADVGGPTGYRYFVSCVSDANGDGRIGAGESDAIPNGDGVVRVSPASAAPAKPVRRVSGADREGTSIAISRDGWKDGGAGCAVLSGIGHWTDALAGTPLATARRGPILLTGPILSAAVENEIARVVPAGGPVYLLGGTAAIPEAVAARLASRGFDVQRIAGPDRFATARAVAAELGHPATVVLADATSFADAELGGWAAARLKGSLLLTDGETLPGPTRDELAAHRPTTRVAVGSGAANADPAADPIVGADRWDTARKVADRYAPSPVTVAIVDGTDPGDGLSAATRAATAGVPLLLSLPWSVPGPVFSWLAGETGSLASATVYGGVRAVDEAAVVGLLDAIN